MKTFLLKPVIYFGILILFIAFCFSCNFQSSNSLSGVIPDSNIVKSNYGWNYFSYKGEVMIHPNGFYQDTTSSLESDIDMIKKYVIDERFAIDNQEIFISITDLDKLIEAEQRTDYLGLMLIRGYDIATNKLLDLAYLYFGKDNLIRKYLILGGKKSDFTFTYSDETSYSYSDLIIFHDSLFLKSHDPYPCNEMGKTDFQKMLSDVSNAIVNQGIYVPKDTLLKLRDISNRGNTYENGIFFARGFHNKIGYFDLAWLEPTGTSSRIAPYILGGMMCPCIPCCSPSVR